MRSASKQGLILAGALSALACSNGSSSGGPLGGKVDPGAAVTLSESPAASAERQALEATLNGNSELTTDGLIARYAPAAEPAPSFDPANVLGLDRIQASSLALNDAELASLGERGFVISARTSFPTFSYGYRTAYLEHLPVYVSADSILFAMHRSYDDILKQFESALLIADLSQLLEGLRGRLASGGASELSAAAQADVDVYLAVARSLLEGQAAAPVGSGDAAFIKQLVAKAEAAQGMAPVVLFGSRRDYDFSQFKPRGHYTDSTELSRYFRAMIWLGRTDFRLIETESDGSQRFLRRQFEGAVALRTLLDASLEPLYRQIDDTVSAFVGEHDYMVVDQVGALLSDLGVASPSELAALPDARLAQAVIDGGYGAQRIASQIMINGGTGTLPLARSFALLGQRYVIDSEVFSNLVYDRLPSRMMPSPLDVAFSALQNGQAATLLRPELERYEYAPALANMRTLVEAHPDEFWQENLYNLWLTGLQALSPPSAASAAPIATLPPTMRSEAWGRRLLSTQLASWAELRHDTILYAKQSYTTGAVCEFPDAYVDPYPEFYARVSDYAASGQELLEKLGVASNAELAGVSAHFKELAAAASKLQEMAEHELAGVAFTPEMLAFINQAVEIHEVCGRASATGWYPRLFFGSSVEFDPTIADVHTQPTDEGGNPVGKVLHVGTGYARTLVAVVDTCSGPRAYVGPVSSYYEEITTDFERLNDIEWAKRVKDGALSDVEWMKDLVAH